MKNICLCCGKELKNTNQIWHPACIKKMFGQSQMPNFDLDIDRIVDENLNKSEVVTGVQKKLSLASKAFKVRKTLASSNDEFIVKIQEDVFPNITLFEWIGMRLANICGIETVECGIVPINNEYIFITKRIDRSNNKKIPMEDFCQLSNSQTEYKYNGSYERCYKNVIKKYSDYETIDKIKFYNLVLFSYIIGNTDMHLKNFSLYENNGHYQLTPAYDLVPVLMVFNQQEMALTINGKNKNLTKNDFYSFGFSMDIDKNILDKIHAKYLNYLDKMICFINDTKLSDNDKKKFIELITANVNKLCK